MVKREIHHFTIIGWKKNDPSHIDENSNEVTNVGLNNYVIKNVSVLSQTGQTI